MSNPTSPPSARLRKVESVRAEPAKLDYQGLLILLAAGLAGTGVAVAVRQRTDVLWVLFLMTGLCLLWVRRGTRLVTSPIAIVPVGFLLMAVAGPTVYDSWAPETVGAAVHLQLIGQTPPGTAELWAASAFAFASGGLVGLLVFARPGRRPPSAVSDRQRADHSRRLLRRVALLSTVPIALLLIGAGPSLLTRDSYLGISGIEVALKTGSTLSLAGLIGASFVVSHPLASGRLRIVGVALVSIYVVINLALASRELALAPLLIFIGWRFGTTASRTDALPSRRTSRQTRSRNWWQLPTALCASVASLPLPLALRGSESQHGLFPYAAAIAEGEVHLSVSLKEQSINVLNGYPTAGYVAFEAPRLDASALWGSLSPVPDRMDGFGAIGESLRLTEHIPYNAVGELGNHGYPTLLLYFTFAGALFALASALAGRLLRGEAGGLALAGLAGMFTLICYQYNLRSATRLLYIVAASALVLVVMAVARSARLRQ